VTETIKLKTQVFILVVFRAKTVSLIYIFHEAFCS